MKWLVLSFLILTSTAQAAKFVCPDGKNEPLVGEYVPDFDCVVLQVELTHLTHWGSNYWENRGARVKTITLEYEKDVTSETVRYRKDEKNPRDVARRGYFRYVTVDAKRRDMEGRSGTKFNLKMHKADWMNEQTDSFICEIVE